MSSVKLHAVKLKPY